MVEEGSAHWLHAGCVSSHSCGSDDKAHIHALGRAARGTSWGGWRYHADTDEDSVRPWRPSFMSV